ncbi:MAG: type II toxin-antitoxin system VapC family toxin [Deltaproteobacteria bacterium]|nr:type II toxin-antitoxin system VapC family toxin [Deltaproteobacteria bacterium]
MIGIDTNVLVRYLAQDDVQQSAVATRLFEHSLREDAPGFLTLVALVETVWVMEDLYGADRRQIAAIVETLLHTRTLVVANAETVWRALAGYRDGTADFADFLIHESSIAAGCTTVYTFDKVAARDSGMRLLQRTS